VVGVSWFVFTAFGLVGYALVRKGHVRRASAFLAVYSISGIIGIGHYAADGMTDAVWWRQAHVVADVVLGLAVFAFAVWAARHAEAADPRTGPKRRGVTCSTARLSVRKPTAHPLRATSSTSALLVEEATRSSARLAAAIA